jgi:hypothetical protein
MKRNHGMTHSRAFIKPKLEHLLDIDNFLQGDLISLQFLIESNDPNSKEQYGISPPLCRSLAQKIKTKNQKFLHI